MKIIKIKLEETNTVTSGNIEIETDRGTLIYHYDITGLYERNKRIDYELWNECDLLEPLTDSELEQIDTLMNNLI